MDICSSCLLSLKGILHQSLKIPSLLPLPRPPLGPGGLGSPWLDPSQGSCLASAIPRLCPSTPSSRHCRVILSRHCCCHLIRSRQLCWAFHPSTPAPPPADLSVRNLTAECQHHMAHPPPPLPEPQVPTVYHWAASSRKSSYQSLPPQSPPALNHLRLDNLLLSVLFFSPLFW